MICPCCLREVPELHGPERLCLRCMTLLGEDDLAASLDLFPPADESWIDEYPFCEEDFIPEMAWGCVGEEAEAEAEEEFEALGDEGCPSGLGEDGVFGPDGLPPTFQGSPRF